MKKVLEAEPSSASPPAADPRFTTISGRAIEPVYRPADVAGVDYDRDLGDPGQYPFTRGIHETMYRGKALDDAAVRRLRHAPRRRTRASSTCSSTAAAGCRSRSTCRR